MAVASRPNRVPLGGYLKFRTKATAPPLSTATTAIMYMDGTNIMASIVGGAYSALATLGGSPSFTSPVTITTATAPALTVTSTAVTGNVISLTNTATLTGTLTGFALNLSGGTPGAQVVQGFVLTGAATTAAKAASQSVFQVSAQSSRMRVLGLQVRNKSALKLAAGSAGGVGSIFSIGWDTTNFEDAVADSILTGYTGMVTLDGISNVDAATNNVSFNGLTITCPVTTDATATTATAAGIVNVFGTSALLLFSRMTAATVLDVVAQNTSGTLASVRYPSGITTTLAGATTALSLNASTNVTHGSQQITGLSITVPATDVAAAAGVAAIAINSDATLQRVLDIDVANLSGTLAQIRYGASTVPTATGITGWLVDLSTNLTPATNDPPLTGVDVRIGATDAAAANGQAAIAITSAATAARAIDVSVTNTSGVLAYIRYPTGPTLPAGALNGLVIDLQNNVSASANLTNPLQILTAAGTRADTAGEGVFSILSRVTAQRVVDVAVRNTSAATGLMVVYYDASTTLAGAVTGVSLNLATNVVPGTQTVTGLNVTIPSNAGSNASLGYSITRSGAATATGTFSGSLVNVQNTPTGGGAGVTLTENGVLVNVNHAPVAGAQAITDTTTGIRCTLTPSTVNSTGLRGLDLLFGANVTGGTLANMSWNGAATLTAATTMLSLDGSTNVTHGTQQITGLSIAIPATDVAAANGVAALYINSDATVARVFDVDVANTSGIPARLRWGAATTLATAAMVAFEIDGQTNVTPSALGWTGLRILAPADTAAASNGRAALYIDSDATLANIISVVAANTSGTLARVSYQATTLATAATTMLLLDGTTNITAGSVGFTGLDIRVPADTASAAAGRAALAINSDATLARVLDIDVANTSGTLAQIRYGAATTFATAATTMMHLNGLTNVTPGSIEFHGLTIDVPASSSASTTGLTITSTQTGAASSGISVAMTPGSAAAVVGQTITMAANCSSYGLYVTHAGTASAYAGFIDRTNTNAMSAVLNVARSGTWSGGGTDGEGMLRNIFQPTISATATWNGALHDIVFFPAVSSGTLTASGALLQVRHVPQSGTITDTTRGITVTMTPLASSAVVGQTITMAANTSAAGYAQDVAWNTLAGATNGVVRIALGVNGSSTGATTMLNLASKTATFTLGAALTGINCNLATNIANTDQQTTGLAVTQVTTGSSTQRLTHGATSTGATWTEGWWTETLTMAATATTADTTNTIPANSFIEAIDCRVTQAPGGGATTFTLGDESTAARFLAATSVALNTTGIGLAHLQGAIASDAAGPVTTAAIIVRATANLAVTGASMTIRVTVRYRTYVASTS